MSAVAIHQRCRLCSCGLTAERPDNLILGVCYECSQRPEARRLRPELETVKPQGFNPADKALIRKLHGFMPVQQLLELLNERRRADLGPDAEPHSAQALHAECGGLAAAAPAAGDWGGLRKLLVMARRDGVLQRIKRQTIDDFAVVWSLNPVQVLRLKDALCVKC